jgi:predicted metal-dependent phosphoesterase TrpH
MPRIDHHLHTDRYSPDSIIDPQALVERACEVGLDGVVITEHDVQWPADELRALAEYGRRHDLVVLSGAEVSAREGHFLVYGLPDLDEAPPGIELGALLDAVRRHGAAVVAAHPFRWDQDFEALVAEHGRAFHALELVSNNVTPVTRARTEELLQRHPMGVTGSSDGHDLEVVGCYFTEFAGPITSIADFVAALHRQDGRPRHNPGARQASGPVD